MKRMFILLLCAVLCLAMGIGAFADVAIEPADSSFYDSHPDECEYENRKYITNGSEGYVLIYDSPEDSTPKTAVKNGVAYWVLWIYEDWGCFDYDPKTMESWGSESGWVKLGDMSADYDSDSFIAEHSLEIDDERGLSISIKDGESVAVWKYPGSGILKTDIGNYTNEPEKLVEFSRTYTDSQGRDWGWVGYFYGRVNGWVCISDPMNTELEADENYREPEIVPACSDEELASVIKETKAPNYAILTGAFGFLIMAAAVLVYVVKRQKKQNG